jgi:glc operon protein GlcG
MTLPGATLIEGGVPLVYGSEIVGAIGVSGALSSEDGQVALAGAQALTKR